MLLLVSISNGSCPNIWMIWVVVVRPTQISNDCRIISIAILFHPWNILNTFSFSHLLNQLEQGPNLCPHWLGLIWNDIQFHTKPQQTSFSWNQAMYTLEISFWSRRALVFPHAQKVIALRFFYVRKRWLAKTGIEPKGRVGWEKENCFVFRSRLINERVCPPFPAKAYPPAFMRFLTLSTVGAWMVDLFNNLGRSAYVRLSNIDPTSTESSALPTFTQKCASPPPEHISILFPCTTCDSSSLVESEEPWRSRQVRLEAILTTAVREMETRSPDVVAGPKGGRGRSPWRTATPRRRPWPAMSVSWTTAGSS